MNSHHGILVGVVVASALWAWPAAGQVVISEFRTRGPSGANDEFIELYNTSGEAVNIGGYKVKGSNSAGTVGVRATIPAGTVMGPRTFYLLVNTASGGYSGTVAADQGYTTGISDDGGLALTDAADRVLDAIGMSSGSAFQEGGNLAQTTQNREQSYERKTASCGPDQDTNDNAADFQYNNGASHPQNSATCRLACAGDPCVTPPPPQCHDEGTLWTFPSGTCEGTGTCLYVPEPVVCDFGCDAVTAACRPDPCEGVVCDTPPNTQCWEAIGACVDGVCEYVPFGSGTPCDDGDACSEGDACDGQGRCAGTMKVCATPDPECTDPDTSRHYTGAFCHPEAGECVFPHEDTTCKFGCDEGTGLCANDPCAGVVCNTPPNAQCWEAAGTCADGACEYAPLAEGLACDDQDPCTVDDECDADHECAGTAMVCDAPPDPQCYETIGTCVDGACDYAPLDEGTPCDDGDPCTEPDACGADHACAGEPKVCPAPAPVCTGPETSRLEINPACDPADGACRGTAIDEDCAGLGCDEVFGTCNRLPVISQFRTRGPSGGNDEFVELFNPSAANVDLGGWTLRGSSETGTTSIRATVPPGTVLGPRTFFLFVNTASNGYSGAVPGDLKYSVGIADRGGVALVDAAGAVVDAVGMAGTSAYLEGTPLAPTLVNQDQAYERKTLACGPDRDLGDNASDFAYLAWSHPRNSRTCRLACAGDPCVMPPAPWCQDDATLNTYPAGECSGDDACEYPLVPVACEFGCEAGACEPDPCEGVVCDTPPNTECWEADGTCADGVCSYERFETGTDCDDGDACTEWDDCDDAGQCTGSAVVCPAKGPECVDAGTSRTYAAGTCDPESGDCLYEPTDTACEFGCDGVTGLCLGDPCAGVTCDDPPSPCHASQGTCSGGTCSYAPLAKGAPCDDGDSCTQDDACDGGGGCAGTPLVCDRPPGPCHEAAGECEDGTCVHAALAQGTPCDDQDPCTTDDACDGAGLCAGTPDPGCVPPDRGEDTGPGDAAPIPDDVGVVDPGPQEDAAPDAAAGDPAPPDGAQPLDAISWPEAAQDGTLVDTAGRDVVADAGPTPRRGGGGTCSAANGGAFPAATLVLLVLAACGLGTRRRRA